MAGLRMACNETDNENKEKYTLVDKFFLLYGTGVTIHALFFQDPNSLVYFVEVLSAFYMIYLALKGKNDQKSND
jgi:threonine/homoserine/homoserine lactone efflux protein